MFDEIDVILHSVTSGQTCWFQAKPDHPTGDPAKGLDGTRVPSPTDMKQPDGTPPAERFWHTPQQTAEEKCGECHDNDPYYYSPWIAQTGQLPADVFGRYRNDIGPMAKWTRSYSLAPRGNTCTGCHRIGSIHTCSPNTDTGKGPIGGMVQTYDPSVIIDLGDWGRGYPQSHWMPAANLHTKAEWDILYPATIAQLAKCCENPLLPECNATLVDSITDGQ